MALSPKELLVMVRLCEGKRDKEIAKELRVAETTVRTYVRLCVAKLDCDNRTQAVLKFDRQRRPDSDG